MNTGIYKIHNKVTSDFYIGSATSFYNRKAVHLSLLRRNIHDNSHLQRAWNKYGEENFEFILISKCPQEYLLKLEQWFVDSLKPSYNIRTTVNSNYGLTFSEEHKKNLSKALKGKKRTQEQKEHQSKIKIGKRHKNETKLKVSNYVNEAKGTRIGDKITKEQIVLFANKFNSEFNSKTIKQICKENGLNYKSIIRFTQNQTFKEFFYLLNAELLKDIKNPSKTKIKSQNGL